MTQSMRAKCSNKLTVLEEIFIIKKVFVLVCRSAELTLKPLGSSPYEKDKSLIYLYRMIQLFEREFITKL